MIAADHLTLLPAPDTTIPHVVIVGGGFAGIKAARALRKAPVRITLIDRHNHHLFQPLLYQVATASLGPSEIAHPIRGMVRNQENTTVLLAEVTAIDLEAHTVGTDRGDLPYDYLVIAAGARTTWFGRDDLRVYAPGLKSVDDALAIRSRVLGAFEEAEATSDPAVRQRAMTFVIVGGGPTGVEMAGALAELARETMRRDFRRIDPASARILLLEGGDRLLATYPERLSRSAQRTLERLGVEVRLGQRLTDAGDGFVRIGTEEIATATVLWAAGIEGEPIGQTLGIDLLRGGRIPAEADLSLEGHPEVFVAGDINGTMTPKGTTYPGVAQVAMQQGTCAGKNIARLIAGAPTKRFRYFDKGNMATIGRNKAVLQMGPIAFSGILAWLAWATIHILFLIDFRSKVTVFSTWVWSYLTHGRSARLITGRSEAVQRDGDTVHTSITIGA
jgi:NADH dehydrogenase